MTGCSRCSNETVSCITQGQSIAITDDRAGHYEQTGTEDLPDSNRQHNSRCESRSCRWTPYNIGCDSRSHQCTIRDTRCDSNHKVVCYIIFGVSVDHAHVLCIIFRLTEDHTDVRYIIFGATVIIPK